MLCSGAAAACSKPVVAGADRTVGAKGFDAALADKAILAELNYQRCKAGLPGLKASANLRSVADTHARWMAASNTVSHRSTVPGQGTLKARISSSGVRARAASENIAMLHRFDIDGTSFKVRDASACAFATNGGKAIPAHSYASLARRAVGLWMASSGHRKNILDRKVTMVGSAAAVDPSAPYCGQIYLSQNFAG